MHCNYTKIHPIADDILCFYNIFVRILTSVGIFRIMAKLPTRQLIKFRPVNSFPIKDIF